jgi:4-diphosphocytidyl-2-C-methyl-D-erythritol kinase
VGRSVRVTAPAKLNLALAVVGKRDDGYHELRSVFVTLDLVDDVRVAPHKRLEVRNPVGVDGEDLAARAVKALARAVGREPLAFISIRKRIPLAAGLGGGSSDAGATLRGLARLWGVEADLVRIGAEVGSDVPFFVTAMRAALVSGRGERVRELPAARAIDVVVLRPPLKLPTAEVFAAFTMSDRTAAAHVDQLVVAFEERRVTPDVIRTYAANDLLAAAERRCEAITTWRTAAAARGIPLFLTGSGPTLFGVADDRGDAIRIARILKRAGMRAHPHKICV